MAPTDIDIVRLHGAVVRPGASDETDESSRDQPTAWFELTLGLLTSTVLHFMLLVGLAVFCYFTPQQSADAQACREQLTICLAATEQLAAARREYEQLAANGTPRAEVVLAVADAAYRGKDYLLARNLFQQLAQAKSADDTEVSALVGLGWSQFHAGDVATAATTFADLVDRFPNSEPAAEAAFTAGQALEKQNKVEAALEMYLRVVNDYANAPQAENALLRAARASDLLDHNQAALTMYDKLLSTYADSEFRDDALYQSAWVAQEEGQAAESAARFLRLHQEHRDSRYWPDATYRLATDAHRAAKHDDTRRLLDDLIASDPPAAHSGNMLFTCEDKNAVASGNWDQLKTPLTRLVTTFPASRLRLPAEYWLAETQYQQESFAEATKQFDDLARKIGGVEGNWPAMVPLRRAQLMAHEKKWTEAAQLAGAIVKTYPDFKQTYEVHYLLGRCHFANAKFNEAREQFAQAIAATGGRKLETAAMAQWMIGESFFHQKNYETAIREYYRVEALYGFARWQCGRVCCRQASVTKHLGRFREAVAAYDRVVDDYPETNFTAEAARRRVVARQRAELAKQSRTTKEY